MQRTIARVGLIIGLGFGTVFFLWNSNVQASRVMQIPTGSVPTVTGPVIGATIIVLQNEQGFANVRSGPGTLGYEVVGVLVAGQQSAALGRTVVGDWILISYPGIPGGVAWIWKDLVEVRGNVPIVEPPATSTPRVTPTLDPTLASQFLVDVLPTRLPTYTAPPPISIPTYVSDVTQTTSGRVPIGFVIIGLGVLGIFGLLISFLRGR